MRINEITNYPQAHIDFIDRSLNGLTASQSYIFTDEGQGKNGVRYYRLKNTDAFGNYSYLNAVPVVFDEELEWQVFPNPFNGKYNLIYQSMAGGNIQVRILNSVGALIKEMHLVSNGFVQKQEIDLSKNSFATGVYLLQIKSQEKTHILRLLKQ